jgi:hypothetical protein
MDLSELIKEAVNLRHMTEEAGADYGNQYGDELRSACPLHGGDNKTAFTLYLGSAGEKDSFYCWGCEKGGDALEFYKYWKSIGNYKQAIESLAEYAGVELDWHTDPARAEEELRKRLRSDVLDEAARYYQALLWSESGAKALAYARRRGFLDGILKGARWGYSDCGPGLLQHLQAKGCDIELAMDMGLVRRLDHDDFTANKKGREAGPNGFLIYPHIVNERVIYLSSRAVEGKPEEGYKPLPADGDKARNLPGAKRAYRAEVRGKAAAPGAADSLTVVEGPPDALTLAQLGYSAWALCGLSLGKDEQGRPNPDIEDLARRKGVYISPDADKAGQEKLEKRKSKLADLCARLGPLTLIMPRLAEAKDYNAWLTSKKSCTAADIASQCKEAITWLETRMLMAKGCSPIERDERMLEIGKLLAGVPDASRAYYHRRGQEILEMTKQEIKELISTALGKNNGHALGTISNRQICFAGRPMGNFWARITEERSLDDGQSQPEIKFKIQGGLSTGEHLDDVEIDAGEYASMQWINKRWGYRPVLHVNRGGLFDLARAIQEVSTDVQRRKVYTYTGWAEVDGKWSYLTSNGSISADGVNCNTQVDLGPNNLRHYALPCEIPEGEAAYRAARASVDFLRIGARGVTAMLWAAMYAAPVTCITPLYAVLWVYGTTQTGKSTISHAALAHFGPDFVDGHTYHAPVEFSLSTYASMEGAAFAVKDAPLVLDDFAPQFASRADAADLHKRAHAIVRAVGNRSGKGRSQANLKERATRAPRGLVLATAENPLTGQSTVGRLIYVPIARGDIIPDGGKVNPRLDEAQQQAQAGLYAQAMVLYIRWLASNWDYVKTAMKSRAEEESSWLRQQQPTLQSRLPDYFGLLVAAQGMALEAFEDMGLIGAKEHWAEYDANKAAIKDIVVRQAEAINAESPIRKVMSALGSLLARGRVYLAPRKPRDFYPPENAELIGWYDPDDKNLLYFDADTILTVAKRYWKDLDENLDIFPDTLKRQIDQAGLLAKRGDTGHIEARVNILGTLQRVLVVDASRVEALYEVQIMPGEGEK